VSIRDELLKTIETMNEENLAELLEYARWLQADKVELNLEERWKEEVLNGEKNQTF